MSIDKLKTKFFTGAWLTDVKHYFTKINEIIDYLNGIKGEGSYKVYTALLTQSGTDAPVAIVLQNTLGVTVTYGYTATGVYSIELGTAYASGKVGIFISPFGNSNNYALSSTIGFQYDGTTGYILRTFDSTGALSDKGLGNTMIEIRVYN